MQAEQQQFLQHLQHALQQGTFQRLVMSQYRGDVAQLQKITCREITLQQQRQISFVFHYPQQQQTKNYPLDEAIAQVAHYLLDCKQLNLFTLEQEIQLKQGKKSSRLSQQKLKNPLAATHQQQHDRSKQRYLAQDRLYLKRLGITDEQGQIIPAMSRKWKQINKFVEILSGVLDVERALHIVDFGSGKGYLTFALYDYLQQHGQAPYMTGVELRHHLVEFCQQVAKDVDFQQLDFFEGDVRSYQPQQLDVMIALHACDVATDFAIHTGIRLNAQLIVCSPCCHKELRPQLTCPNELKPMLQFGIHAGQQAEMLTDTLRALLLQAYGYETKVFEFVALEHTSKNKMILAVKKANFTGVDEKVLQQIQVLKQMYGIKQQMLEQLLAQTV
ncbi:MAG: SAM-dependent methyltransferase [Acinetobacter sp.]|nr:SAM-dependent methyltransferase [Acinetobacter sp.]